MKGEWSGKHGGFSKVITLVILLLASFLIPLATFHSAAAQIFSANSPPQAVAMTDSKNSLIVHIEGTVSSPGKVIIEYGNSAAGSFIIGPVSTTGATFSAEVLRLRANTQYDYKVFLIESSQTPIFQYQGTFTTGALPKGLQNASINLLQGTPTYDLVLLDFNDTDFNGLIAIDRNGNIVWYYQHDRQVFSVAQRDNNNLVFNEVSLINGYSMTEVTPDGKKIHSVDDSFWDGLICQPHGRWHHELLIRPNNKVWTLGSEIRSVKINGQDTLQTGATVEEWDTEKGTVTRLVSAFDLLDPVKDRTQDSNLTSGFFWQGPQNQYAGYTEDWNHANSLDVLPDGTVLMSVRHLDQIIAIKPDFSGIAWKLGGTGSDFTFPDPDDQFYHQHYAHMLPNGHILLFDNGNFRPQEQGGQYSRALELELDWQTMEARQVWEYRYTPDLFASAVGSVIRLNNGNTVIDYGFDDVDVSPTFTLVEADPNGNTVAATRISAPGKGDQYRAIPLDSLNGEKRGSVAP